MIEKLEIKLVELFEKISIKAILIFIVLNFLVAGTSYFFLDSYSKKNAIWTKQVKFNIPRYTVVRDSEYLIRYHDILSQKLLLEKITQSRFEGNLRSICNIQEELFDDHIFYKWMKSSTSRINYSVVLNIRHSENKSLQDCVEEFKKLIATSYEVELDLYLSLLRDIVSREKADVKRYEKEYADLLKIYNIDTDAKSSNSMTQGSEILKSYNLGLFSLMSDNKRNFDRLNKQLSKIEYEIEIVIKDLQIQIEYENSSKSYKSIIPILMFINVVFSFLLIFLFLLLNLRKKINQ